MTDAAYHAAFHEMMITFIVVPDPTGAGMIPRIVEWSRRGAVELEVAKRALREICDSDGGEWPASVMAHWIESEVAGIEWSEAASLAEYVRG